MNGVSTALDLAMAQQPDDDEAEQLDMLGLPETDKLRILRAEKEARRGPGRPPGARNKFTVRTAEWLLSRFRDPRAVLLELANAPVDELMAAGMTFQQAVAEKRLAAMGVLPYVVQRQPLAVDLTNRKVVHLTIVDGGEFAAADEDGSLTARILENIEYQELSDDREDEVGQS